MNISLDTEQSTETLPKARKKDLKNDANGVLWESNTFLKIKLAGQSENKMENTKAVYFLKERDILFISNILLLFHCSRVALCPCLCCRKSS